MSVEIKTIKGFIGYENEVIPQSEQVTVRFTSDRYGETISLENGNVMLGVPFETVQKMVEKARKNK